METSLIKVRLALGSARVAIRPLDESDALAWDGLPSEAPGWVTAIIERTVSACELDAGATPSWEEFPIADRLRLLVEVLRLSFGEEIWLVQECPRPECSARLDVDLACSELLAQEATPPAEIGRGERRFATRLPTARDQENWREGEPGFAERVLRSCLAAGVPEPQPAEVAPLLEEILAGWTGPRFTLEVECAECARPFQAAVNLAELFRRGIGRLREELESEVHQLALHYHWSERDILAMGRARRRRYVQRLEGSWT